MIADELTGACYRVRGREDGIAYIMVLAFIGLALPITLGALQLSSQLSISAQLHQDRLAAAYSSGGALEAALLEIKTNPENPNDLTLELNGGTTMVIIDGSATSSSDLSAYAYSDFVLSLDVSGSISDTELLDLQDATHTIVDAFDLDQTGERVRIGITKFASTSTDMVAMTDFDAVQTSPPSLHFSGVPLHDPVSALDDLRVCEQYFFVWCILWGDPDVGSRTNIVDALNTAAAHYASGLGDRLEISNLMVVITDGDDSTGNSDQDIADASTATGAEVFAVGVGSSVNTNTLNAIASEPDVDHVLTATDFQDLLNIIESIVQAVNAASDVGAIYDIDITTPNGNVLRCRALLTLAGEVVLLSCQ